MFQRWAVVKESASWLEMFTLALTLTLSPGEREILCCAPRLFMRIGVIPFLAVSSDSMGEGF